MKTAHHSWNITIGLYFCFSSDCWLHLFKMVHMVYDGFIFLCVLPRRLRLGKQRQWLESINKAAKGVGVPPKCESWFLYKNSRPPYFLPLPR